MPVAGANRRVIIGRRRDLGKAPSSARGAVKKPSRLRGFLSTHSAPASRMPRRHRQAHTSLANAKPEPTERIVVHLGRIARTTGNSRRIPGGQWRSLLWKARRRAAGRRQMRHGRWGLAPTQGSARDPFWKRPLQSLQFELCQTCGPAVNCSRLRLPGPIHKFRESKKG